MLTSSSRATGAPPRRVAALIAAVGLTLALALPAAGWPAGSSSTGRRITAGPSYDQVKTWAKAYKAAHPGNGGKDWDINAKTPAQLASDRAAARLVSICGADQRPVIPIIAWEYGGKDHQWINPSASSLVYCVYTPVRNATSHWRYDAAAARVTADVYVKYPDQNPCRARTGRDQVARCDRGAPWTRLKAAKPNPAIFVG